MAGEPAKIEVVTRPRSDNAPDGMRSGLLQNEFREPFTVSGPVRVCGWYCLQGKQVIVQVAHVDLLEKDRRLYYHIAEVGARRQSRSVKAVFLSVFIGYAFALLLNQTRDRMNLIRRDLQRINTA